jgi:hypothetical protein
LREVSVQIQFSLQAPDFLEAARRNKMEALPHPFVPSFVLINFASCVLQLQGCSDDFCGLKAAK